jgi:hypothetical protein
MGTKRLAISFRDLDTISTWLTTLLGGGPDRSRVELTRKRSGSGWAASGRTSRRVLFTASSLLFGGGLTWGSTVFRWPEML